MKRTGFWIKYDHAENLYCSNFNENEVNIVALNPKPTQENIKTYNDENCT